MDTDMYVDMSAWKNGPKEAARVTTYFNVTAEQRIPYKKQRGKTADERTTLLSRAERGEDAGGAGCRISLPITRDPERGDEVSWPHSVDKI